MRNQSFLWENVLLSDDMPSSTQKRWLWLANIKEVWQHFARDVTHPPCCQYVSKHKGS